MSKAAFHMMFLVVSASVLATAIFGFSVMSEPDHMMTGCFGLAPGAVCSMLSPIEHFAAHLRAFQSISAAVVRISSLLPALILLALAGLALTVQQSDNPQGAYAVKRRGSFISPRHSEFTRWLALHEKRDPSFARAMNG